MQLVLFLNKTSQTEPNCKLTILHCHSDYIHCRNCFDCMMSTILSTKGNKLLLLGSKVTYKAYSSRLWQATRFMSWTSLGRNLWEWGPFHGVFFTAWLLKVLLTWWILPHFEASGMCLHPPLSATPILTNESFFYKMNVHSIFLLYYFKSRMEVWSAMRMMLLQLLGN